MTEKIFINRVADEGDILSKFLHLLNEMRVDYCVIGGLAVNAYCEPVVSLDLDVVVVAPAIDELVKSAERIFTIKRFRHSINLESPDSDLRIQLQTDPSYQDFIKRAEKKKVLGYEMMVADLEDVLKGKLWAYSDEEKRRSKRQKDLADIFRLVENHPHLQGLLPDSIK